MASRKEKRQAKREARKLARGNQGAVNRQNIKETGAKLDAQRGNLEQAGQFTNTFEGIQGASYDPTQAQVGQLGDAAQAQLGTLGSAQGYTAQGYDAQGYSAAQTNQVKGANARDILSNPYANLQVATASSDARARDAERGQAALQEQLAQTGGGGATALLQASQASREGIRGDIQQQEAQNAQLRAQGQQSLEQGILQQENFGAQLDVGQQQFNVGAQNQASQFSASAQNQAAQFGAQAQNQAAQFGAQANNQFALEKFSAENQLNQFNAGAQNSFAQAQFGAANQFNLANQQASNQAAQFGASSGFQAQTLQAQGAAATQDNLYNAAANLYSQDANAAQAANQAEADRKAANKQLVGSIVGGALGAVGSAASGGVFGKIGG